MRGMSSFPQKRVRNGWPYDNADSRYRKEGDGLNVHAKHVRWLTARGDAGGQPRRRGLASTVTTYTFACPPASRRGANFGGGPPAPDEIHRRRNPYRRHDQRRYDAPWADGADHEDLQVGQIRGGQHAGKRQTEYGEVRLLGERAPSASLRAGLARRQESQRADRDVSAHAQQRHRH